MGRNIAISDIHGCPNTFLALLDQLSFDHSDQLFLLGDYIDRGPDSKGVIDAIWQLQKQGFKVHCLLGNHEQIMLNNALAEQRQGILGLGPRELLDSFGVRGSSEIPVPYLNWAASLKYYLELPGYLLVHAGFNFHQPDPMSDRTSMLWIRSWRQNLNSDWLRGRVIVYGHTPQPAETTREQLEELDEVPALCIDCGCALGQAPYGQLCAFDLTNRVLFFQENAREYKHPHD